MRWLVMLQVALGLGALFVAGAFALDGYLAPVEGPRVARVAQADAQLAAAEAVLGWERTRIGQRTVADALARGVVADILASRRDAAERDRALKAALDSAIAQAGGSGKAALVGTDRRPLVLDADAELLAGVAAVGTTLAGSGGAALESLEGRLHVVATSPVRSGAQVVAALIIATPLDERLLRSWAPTLPAGVSFGLIGAAGISASTAPQELVAELRGSEPGARMTRGEETYAVARREVASEAGQLIAFGLARHDGAAQQALVARVELLLVFLGGAAFLVVALLLLLGPGAPSRAPLEALPLASSPLSSPAGVPAMLADPPKPPKVQEPSRPAATGPTKPQDLPFPSQFAQKTLPSVPAPSPAPVPSVGPPMEVPKPSTPTAQVGAGGLGLPASAPEERFPASYPGFEEAPLVQPAAPERPRSGGEPRASASGTGPFGQPSPFARPAQTAAAPERSPARSAFDQIAEAAFSAPPPALEPVMGDRDPNLPAPKGGVPPELWAAQRADAQRAAASATPAVPSFGATPYDRELLAPKQAEPLLSGPDLPHSPTRRPLQVPSQKPGSAPAMRAVVPGSAPAYPALSADPWKNPSIPEMPAVGSLRGEAMGAASLRYPQVADLTSRPVPVVPRPEPPRSGTPLAADLAWSPSSGINYPIPSEAPRTAPPAPAPATPSSNEHPRAGSTGEHARPFDDEHYRVVYNEFVASKARLGEAVDNISFEGFRTKLRTSEQALLERHGCRAVRFQVLVKDRTVSLRPQLVR